MITTLFCTLALVSTMQTADIEKAAKINVMRIIDGKLYVGGRFERANRKLVNNVAVFDGTKWTGLGRGVDGEVYDIAGLNGRIFVAGDFSFANKSTESEGIPAIRIARWDGTAWSALAKYTVDRQIYALATDGKSLFVGGNFTKINNETETRGVARWNGTKFEAIGGKFDRAVMTMTFHKGKLYAGGIFNESGDDSMANIAVYNGSTWDEVGNGGLGSRVSRLSSDGESLFAAGEFKIGGSSGIAKFDGAKWSLAAKTDGSTLDVFAQPGKLYFTGDFNAVNGKPSHKVGALDGAKLMTLDEVVYGHHLSIAPFGGSIILGGGYGDVQSDQIGGVLRWNGEKGIDKLENVAK